MSFFRERLEQIHVQLMDKIKEENLFYLKTEVHVTNKWIFEIQFNQINGNEELIILQKNKRHGMVRFVNGELVDCKRTTHFKYLLIAWNDAVVRQLKNHKKFKISKIAFNERFAPSSFYHWAKIEYFLDKKYIQSSLYCLFGDEKYNRRQLRIEKSLSSYQQKMKAPLLQ